MYPSVPRVLVGGGVPTATTVRAGETQCSPGQERWEGAFKDP